MRKLLALLLALAVVFSLAIPALADQTQTADATLTFEKHYFTINSGTTAPDATFQFKATAEAFIPYDTETTVTKDTMPIIGTKNDDDEYILEATFSNLTAATTDNFANGTLTGTDKGVNVAVDYAAGSKPTVAGEYVYKLEEVTSTIAGITNGKKALTDTAAATTKYLKVYVFHDPQDENNLYIAGTTLYNKWKITDNDKDSSTGMTTAANKSKGFDNLYEATAGTTATSTCNFSVSKVVEGSMGDKSRNFDIQVTITPENGKTIMEDIYFNDNCESTVTTHGTGVSYDKTESKWKIAADNGITTATMITLHVKDGETVNFTNIPVGTTVSVTETDTGATTDGYSTKYTLTTDGTPGEPSETALGAVTIETGKSKNVTVTNTLDATIDTGVILDSAPYVLLLAVAVLGLALVISKKRAARD